MMSVENKRKHFWVIGMDGMIFELDARFVNPEAMHDSFNEQKPVYIQGKSIRAIRYIFEELSDYKNYIDSVNPNMYILNGAWYQKDSKSKPIRYEKWKEDELKVKAVSGDVEGSPAYYSKVTPVSKNNSKTLVEMRAEMTRSGILKSVKHD